MVIPVMQPYWPILLPVALTYFCTHMLLTAQVNNTVTPHIKQNSPYIATMTENARTPMHNGVVLVFTLNSDEKDIDTNSTQYLTNRSRRVSTLEY